MVQGREVHGDVNTLELPAHNLALVDEEPQFNPSMVALAITQNWDMRIGRFV